MRLAVLTNILAPYRIPLFAELSSRTQEFRVFLMTRSHSHRHWKLPPVSFETEVLPGPTFWPPGSSEPVHVSHGVARALGRWRPDVILSGGFGAAGVQAYRYSRGKCHYVSWGELTVNDKVDRLIARRVVRRWLIRGSAACIASTSVTRDAFVYYGASPDRVTISIMPVDVEYYKEAVDAFRASPEYGALRDRYSSPIVLTVGQLVDRKGFAELWSAYERVLARFPATTLLIAGSGPKRDEYGSLVRTKGWSNVHFLGFKDAAMLARLYAIADVFVFPTRHEAFGAVLSEALAARVPVVSSVRAAATRDLIDNRVNGFAADPYDAAAFSGAIERALTLTSSERERMLAAGRDRALQHTFSVAADEIMGVLDSLVGRSPAAGADLAANA